MRPRRSVFALLLAGCVAFLAPPRALGAPGRPAAVPDLRDPSVQAEYVILELGAFGGDSDFPAVLLGRIRGGAPRFLLMVVDARNGRETWSVREDAAVFYLLLDNATTIQQAFLDEGFAAAGRPTGEFSAAGPETARELMARLLERHRHWRLAGGRGI